MVGGVAGQRAIGHEGGGAAAVQIDGVDHSVPLQEVGQLPQTHPAHTVHKSALACSAAGQLAAVTTRGQHRLSPSLPGLSVQLDQNQSTISIMAHCRPRRHHIHEGPEGPFEEGKRRGRRKGGGGDEGEGGGGESRRGRKRVGI